MKRLSVVLLLVFLSIICLGITSSFATEVDILLQKLVEKGVLTAGEAQEIKVETQEQVKKEIASGKSLGLPEWVQNTKLKGDFRLRYQYDHAKWRYNSTTNKDGDQQRARIRVRLGVESKINDKLLAGIGIATGKSDGSTDAARSTNVTLGEGGFGKKPIALDYAYAQYTPYPWVTMVGGKFKNPLWEPADLIWDSDINPEGGALTLKTKLAPGADVFLTTGALTLDNNKTFSADVGMYVVQPGVNLKLTDTISAKGAVSYYDFTGVKGKTLSGNTGTNTHTASGLTYNYRNTIGSLEVSVKDPLKALGVGVPYFALFGEYVKNIDSDVPKNDTGYMCGMKFGAEKVEKWADWQLRYNYAMLEKDAVLDILPDSDRYGGKTGMRAHEVMFDWGLGKNTWLGLNYYYAWQLKGNFGSNQSRPTSLVQVDWNMKF